MKHPLCSQSQGFLFSIGSFYNKFICHIPLNSKAHLVLGFLKKRRVVGNTKLTQHVSVPLTVRHYLTGNPDIEASRELLSLAGSMTRMDKESFIGAFNGWYVKYKDVLNERVQDRRMKTPPYMRPRLRSAYLSLKRNMGRLWTFYDYKDRIIPNTNNGLEAVFADIKSKVRVHSGLTREHRIKLIDEYISRHY